MLYALTVGINSILHKRYIWKICFKVLFGDVRSLRGIDIQ
ncbi:hypothetical protein APHCRT_0981 [Anaplasma phagocytophilum str. CRT53-1]|uniref:Uncharacterized protein n=2 Tax=Anaplasma phagocytophilum TaxID=948 RepID=A0A0F3PYI5_ANAPH|nr:hypothetical protein APHWI1_0362 [Anaplasma phagocytophilum str. ApWI1]KJV85696.1 hypothetical protein APHCRT_0981 [Anaplasma phagocytophilum str. CRT53-1]